MKRWRMTLAVAVAVTMLGCGDAPAPKGVRMIAMTAMQLHPDTMTIEKGSRVALKRWKDDIDHPEPLYLIWEDPEYDQDGSVRLSGTGGDACRSAAGLRALRPRVEADSPGGPREDLQAAVIVRG